MLVLMTVGNGAMVKIKLDGAFDPCLGVAVVGVIARNNIGDVFGRFAQSLPVIAKMALRKFMRSMLGCVGSCPRLATSSHRD
ncbi:hypothetical protein V6N12_050117 [Hibiscus sabdariffa]|uniref:Uncharacterized protein n=1 Tax=Hibiscus sabdariffa TaxID=183260 RepID=A0ABR2GBH4_9ROSI